MDDFDFVNIWFIQTTPGELSAGEKGRYHCIVIRLNISCHQDSEGKAEILKAESRN